MTPEAIHRDFRRVLSPPRSPGRERLALLEEELLGVSTTQEQAEPGFEIDSAFQGKEGVAKAERSLEQGHPYSLIILDYRMPPGWNGVETLRHLREVDPSVPVVLCSAYSDYSWEEILQEFGALSAALRAEEALRRARAAPEGAEPGRDASRRLHDVSARPGGPSARPPGSSVARATTRPAGLAGTRAGLRPGPRRP